MLLASIAELNNDEAYYWTYAKQLQWNYFDHPPMVGICIKIFMLNLHLNQELFIRLTAILAASGCTWIIFKIGKQLHDGQTGWFAACLFTASFYASIIAGLLILPDSPQLFFWLLSVNLLLKIVKKDISGVRVNSELALVGITIGLCVLSKIHGIFLWIGFGGYVIISRRSLLSNPFLYLSGLITLAMLVPSFLWTLSNHFSTYNYHSARVHFEGMHPESFFREIAGEILYSNPVNYVLLVVALLRYRRKRTDVALLKWFSFPLIITVLIISLFNDTLPHWNGPAFVTLIPFTALHLRNLSARTAKLPLEIRSAMGLLITSVCVCIGIINYWPGSLGARQLPELGKNDVTLDMSGWRQLHDSLKNRLTTEASIFTPYWFPGGHLTVYVGQPLHLPVRVVGTLNDIHHFAWLNPSYPSLPIDANAWYITVSNFYKPPSAGLMSYFQKTGQPLLIPQYRSGIVVRYFYIYPLLHYKGGLPANGILQNNPG
ncbi:MAG: glycosyltransferase family 39 protein [Chitinophagaceae bacterium]|nr:glycosyltransferase family 39 protein [Chitinophagaceae bacterium]